MSAKSLESKIASEQKAITVLESSITKIFTSLASGKITQDIFIQKKGVINDTIERKRFAIEKLEQQRDNLIEGRNRSESAIAELKQFKSLEKLSKDIVSHLRVKCFDSTVALGLLCSRKISS